MKRRDCWPLAWPRCLRRLWRESRLAQSRFPDRPIRLVIPFAPGGVNDARGRPWAEKMKSLLGTVVVENIGGAGGSLGAAVVARAAPDGYTLLLGGNSAACHQSDRDSPLALRSGQGFRADLDPGRHP